MGVTIDTLGHPGHHFLLRLSAVIAYKQNNAKCVERKPTKLSFALELSRPFRSIGRSNNSFWTKVIFIRLRSRSPFYNVYPARFLKSLLPIRRFAILNQQHYFLYIVLWQPVYEKKETLRTLSQLLKLTRFWNTSKRVLNQEHYNIWRKPRDYSFFIFFC